MPDAVKPLLAALVGPTCSGKTDVALRLARRLPLVVVSADSRQLYRSMNIGTAKPSPEQLASVPHRFVDHLDPDETYSAGQYEQEALAEVTRILSSDRLPLVVGGSGLYVKALLEGFSAGGERDPELRRRYEEIYQADGEDGLRRELSRVDPITEERIEKGKPRRLIRALEVFATTGRPMSDHHADGPVGRPFRSLVFGLRLPRDILYRRIDRRAARMVGEGLVTEVKTLLSSGITRTAQSMQTVGYKETIDHIDGRLTLEELAPQIAQNTRRFAKRQGTWFRREEAIRWIDLTGDENPDQIADAISDQIERSEQR